jgi:hypothetical protein
MAFANRQVTVRLGSRPNPLPQEPPTVLIRRLVLSHRKLLLLQKQLVGCSLVICLS